MKAKVLRCLYCKLSDEVDSPVAEEDAKRHIYICPLHPLAKLIGLIRQVAPSALHARECRINKLWVNIKGCNCTVPAQIAEFIEFRRAQ